MRNPQGQVIITGPDDTQYVDTFTCSHCSKIVMVPRAIETVGDFCRGCMRLVCAQCAGGGCVTFLQKIEDMERRYHARRQLERLAGL